MITDIIDRLLNYFFLSSLVLPFTIESCQVLFLGIHPASVLQVVIEKNDRCNCRQFGNCSNYVKLSIHGTVCGASSFSSLSSLQYQCHCYAYLILVSALVELLAPLRSLF